MHAITNLLVAEPFINHREVLATILFRQIEPTRTGSRAFQFKVNQTEGTAVSPIRIYKDLVVCKALDKQKIRVIFECLLDFVPLDKPIEVEIPFLGLLRDFFLKLQNEKSLKFQTIVDAMITKFHTSVIQLKETILAIIAEVFKNHHQTVRVD